MTMNQRKPKNAKPRPAAAPPSRQSGSKVAERPRRQTPAEFLALQRLMAQAVMRPLNPDQRMDARWPDGRPTQQIAATFIKPNDRLTSFERLEIYNRQYWFRLSDCFYEDYPGLQAILGERRFAELCVAYLAHHPSTSFTLRNLGRKLVDFVQAEPRLTAPHQEIALDMARLEWSHIEAFDNAAQPVLATEDLRGRDAAQIKLRLQPHLTLLKLAYPLDNYLFALSKHTRLRGAASNAVDDAVHHPRRRAPRLPARRTIHLAVHRHQNVVFYKRLSRLQFTLLNALRQGASLEAALESLPHSGPAQPVQDWFRTWSALGWFC